ncbi:MAG: hypothetical protein ACFCVG_05300 [Kineosporiaceae bacterium]
MRMFQCPACGEAENLSGSSDGVTITVTCQVCRASWPRDSILRCATCGKETVWRPQAVTAFSRGTQLSILGLYQTPMCLVCDVNEYRASVDAGSALPPGYTSRARRRPEETSTTPAGRRHTLSLT